MYKPFETGELAQVTNSNVMHSEVQDFFVLVLDRLLVESSMSIPASWSDRLQINLDIVQPQFYKTDAGDWFYLVLGRSFNNSNIRIRMFHQYWLAPVG